MVSSTHPNDIFLGSSGALIPGVEARIVNADGEQVTAYDTPGELVVRSPSVVLGYLNNEKATKETFEDGWMRTGDEAVIRLSPKNVEHVFITDRIKELIKVKVRHSIIRIQHCHVADLVRRVCKSHRPSLRRIFSLILLLLTVLLSPFPMTLPVKCPRL